LIHKGLYSVSNFAVEVAVARWQAHRPRRLIVCLPRLLVLSGMHRALITDPMAIEGDVRGHGRAARIRLGFAAEVVRLKPSCS
jgi:hypothetical protein